MTLISNTRDDNNQVTLEIRVDGEEFAAAQTAAFEKNAKDIAIPGFRKGKAPRAMIEKMYGENVFTEEAVNLSYSAAYEAAAKEADIHPVDSASIDVVEVSREGYTFKAVVTVRPIVKIEGYKGLQVNKVVKTATEEDVEHELSHMKEKVARMISVTDRAALDGDQVVIDYSGSVDGVKFDGGTAEKQNLTLGSGQFIPGFEEQIVGHEIGDEFDVNVTFPEQYHAEELAGKAAVFACKLHEIHVKEYPEMDDDFAKDVSDFDTLAELKEDLKKHVQEHYNEHSEGDMKNALMDQLAEKMEANIPEVMIEKAVSEQLAEMDYRLQMQGMNLQMYMQYMGGDLDAMRESMKPTAESQVKIRLALEQIAVQENLQADEAAVEAEYENMAKRYNVSVEQAKAAIPASDIQADLMMELAMNFVVENAKVTEVTEEEAAKKPAKKTTKKSTAKKTAKKAEEKVEEAVATEEAAEEKAE
ncbi:MAG: trigger factor [Oscillospiraceae bacterium]|nr:trigger factor [Oscillospiraceae bacterium]